MENENTLVVEGAGEVIAPETEAKKDGLFDKDKMHQDLADGWREFRIGCYEAAKNYLAPLVSQMLKHFFDWLIDENRKS